MRINNLNIVYWQNQPPKVELGALNYLSSKAKSTTYICMNDLPIERKNLGWDKVNYGKAKIHIVKKEGEVIEIANKLITQSDTVNIVSGLSGSMANVICPYFKKNKIKFFVISERPRILFYGIKNILISSLVYLKHFILKQKYNKNVIAILACGKKGCETFEKIGWKKEKIVHFMYCGDYKLSYSSFYEVDDKNIKFLYIGRFGYNHALDIMIKSFDSIKMNNWSLYMAGGYGEKKDEVFKWINSKKNVEFIGKIDSSEVINTIQKYNALIVPSRLEGWNCQICEAIYSCIPVLTFDESISGELINYSNGGISIKGQSSYEFKVIIEKVLENPELLLLWRDNLKKYNNLISPSVVGNYFIQIIESYLSNEKIPECPWEVEREK